MAIPSPDSSYSTLQQIRTKVRRLTRSLSTSQLSQTDLDNYINTFILYDFPEHLRLFTLRKTLTFYTQPYVDTYETNTVNSDDPLYNFNNKYISVHAPIYIAGYDSFFSQSREQFFSIYPKLSATRTTGSTGDGVTTNFTGTLSSVPVLMNSVSFTSVGADDIGLVVHDIPQTDGATGLPTTTGDLVVPGTTTSLGTIDYVTGEYDFDFPSAPASGEVIYSQTVAHQVAQPKAVLYTENKFTLRPVPDKSYAVNVEVYARPSDILDDSAEAPELSQWWQYIAYGAAKKVFEDRNDMESVNQIMPEFQQQELLVLRKTIVQNSNERTATIYTEQTEPGVLNTGW